MHNNKDMKFNKIKINFQSVHILMITRIWNSESNNLEIKNLISHNS